MPYIISLFHDCGIPSLAMKYEYVLINAISADESFITVEEKRYRTSHAVLNTDFAEDFFKVVNSVCITCLYS